MIVVGDRQTPGDWSCEGVEYMSPAAQVSTGWRTAELPPWDHYARRMVGYHVKYPGEKARSEIAQRFISDQGSWERHLAPVRATRAGRVLRRLPGLPRILDARLRRIRRRAERSAD